jgi:hypothetical protein
MLIVVGGQSRNTGKTSLVEAIIRKFRKRQWTALKITQYGHGVCSNHDHHCGCEADPGEPYALTEEYEPGATDSARFLGAGAARSFWLRTRAGELPQAAGALRKILDQNKNVIVESNSVMDLFEPGPDSLVSLGVPASKPLFLMMLDFGCEDFKPSSLRYFDRADTYILVDRGINVPLWEDLARGRWDRKPHFFVEPPRYLTQALSEFIGSRLF